MVIERCKFPFLEPPSWALPDPWMVVELCGFDCLGSDGLDVLDP